MLCSLDLFARRATCVLQVLDPERAASDALVVAKTALRGACLAGFMSTDGRAVCSEVLRWLTDNPAADVAAVAEKRARVDEVGSSSVLVSSLPLFVLPIVPVFFPVDLWVLGALTTRASL